MKFSAGSLVLLLVLAACTPKPPDVPTCEKLDQRVTTDPTNGHTLLTPAPACMENLGEAVCGHCVWIVSAAERWIGEAHKQIQLKHLVDNGKKDSKGKTVYDWETIKDGSTGKAIMVSSWLNDLKPWSEVERKSAYLPAEESYAPLATYIIDACKKMKCSDSVTAFKVKLDSLNGIAGAIKN